VLEPVHALVEDDEELEAGAAVGVAVGVSVGATVDGLDGAPADEQLGGEQL
jgi:hypothetical protein